MTRQAKIAVAAAQYPIDALPSLDAWEEKISRWVAEGAATGARLLVFPEYAAIEQAHCFGPAVYGDLKATLEKVAELAGDRVALHVRLAREHGVHILVGSGPLLKSDGSFVNAAQLVTPHGAVGEQERPAMPPFDRDWGISAGSPVRVFDTALGRIGIAICYDSEFPLLVRAMAEAGAEIVLVPSCTERISGYFRVRTGCLARALENGVATVQSPTVGDALWSPAVDHNAGAAAIFVPSEHMVSDTGVVAEGTLGRPGWVHGAVDLQALERLRLGGEMRNYLDWPLQPGGAGRVGVEVESVDLRR